MTQRRATISDIAAHAGVSVGTVSNVMNSKGRFNEATRERVLRAASELNFTPNALIRSLQSGKTHTIGIFTWAVRIGATRDITMLLLKGIVDGVAAIQCDTLLYSRHPHEDTVTASLFLDRRVDGLILGPGGLAADGLQALADSGLPTVAIYQGESQRGIGTVNIDNISGVLDAMQHLTALGHRRIAFYGPTQTFDFKERLTGYRLGLERANLPYDPAIHIDTVLRSYHFPEVIGEVCDALLRLPDPPTALLAGDDGAALLFLEALTERGVRVPEQMSVVGFDDAPAASAPPGLTTIRQPVEELGRTAAGLVQRLIDGESPDACRVTLPVALVVRNTTAPPRKT